MAQSAEYPDLKWVPPAAFGTGRDGKAVRYIVIHYTAGAERNTSAEDGAAIDQRRTDGVSTHYFADSDSVVQCVLTKDRANAARYKGNRLGIQYELCGTVQTREEWLDAASLPTLKNAARQVARDCRKYGIPVRRLSVAETRQAWYDFPAGPMGIVGHVDCTYAYPEDGGDHTDPGAEFPWDVFLDMVRAELEILDMDEQSIAQAVASKLYADLSNPVSGLFATTVARVRDGVGMFWWDAYHSAKEDDAYHAADATGQRRMRNAEDTVRGVTGGPVDEAAIFAAIQNGHLDIAEVVAGVLAGLGPSVDPQQIAEQVVALLPALPGGQADLVKQFADELAARLAA